MSKALSFGYADLPTLVRALQAPARLSIIKCLSQGPKPSSAVYTELRNGGFSSMERSTFYYHVFVLKEAGLIYEQGQIMGAGKPEKVWALSSDTVIIDLRSQSVEGLGRAIYLMRMVRLGFPRRTSCEYGNAISLLGQSLLEPAPNYWR